MLLVTNDGRKLALDQRLMNPMQPDDPNGKVSVYEKAVKTLMDSEEKLVAALGENEKALYEQYAAAHNGCNDGKK